MTKITLEFKMTNEKGEEIPFVVKKVVCKELIINGLVVEENIQVNNKIDVKIISTNTSNS